MTTKHQRYYRRHRAARRAAARAWNAANRDRHRINNWRSAIRARRTPILAEIARLEGELDAIDRYLEA